MRRNRRIRRGKRLRIGGGEGGEGDRGGGEEGEEVGLGGEEEGVDECGGFLDLGVELDGRVLLLRYGGIKELGVYYEFVMGPYSENMMVKADGEFYSLRIFQHAIGRSILKPMVSISSPDSE